MGVTELMAHPSQGETFHPDPPRPRGEGVAEPELDYPQRLAALTPVLDPPPLVHRYGTEAEQFGELWLPSTPGPHPVVAMIHGGYWRRRYRLDVMHALAADLRDRGVAVWNLEFRRIGSPGGCWPGTFEDVGAGFDALGELSERHGLNVRRTAVLGHSAGGHLALWCAARGRLPGSSGLAPRLRPAAAVALAGIGDLQEAAHRRLSQDAAVELMGGWPSQAEASYRMASPAALLPLGVPQVLVHGTADTHVPFELSEGYWKAARTAGDDCELIRLEGVDHFELIEPARPAWGTVVYRLLDILGRRPAR